VNAKEETVRRLLTIAMLLVPIAASAEHLDVIQGKLMEGCTLEKYVTIKNDFNEQWGRSHGYLAEVASPVQSNDLASVFWIGRTASAEAFGRAWDTWRTEIADSKSVAGKLDARFNKCVTNEARRGYDVH
jgi:hypothetical protein